MKLTFFTDAGASWQIEVPSDMLVQDVKLLVESDADVQAKDQVWVCNGKEVGPAEDDQKLESLGWGEDVVVRFSSKRSSSTSGVQQQQQQPAASGSSARGAFQGPGGQQYTPEQMQQIQRYMQQQSEEQEMMDRLEADPYDIESQKKIEEIMRMKAVMESYEWTMEHQPEAFAQVHMLYIDCEVNGHKVKAFVDSGAQSTIISPECAEACGLMRLIDVRFSGEARGVGTAKILGRVHSATIKLKDLHLPCSFTVLEGKDVDLLFGLDMLKRHQASIDLSKGQGVLRIQGREVPFLSEHELPAKARRETWSGEEEVGGRESKKAKMGEVEVPRGVSATAAAPFPGSGSTLGPSSSAGIPLASIAPSAPAPAPPPPSAALSPLAPSAPPAPAPPASKYPEASIQALVSLGTDRATAVALLDMCGGDVDAAAGSLFG